MVTLFSEVKPGIFRPKAAHEFLMEAGVKEAIVWTDDESNTASQRLKMPDVTA